MSLIRRRKSPGWNFSSIQVTIKPAKLEKSAKGVKKIVNPISGSKINFNGPTHKRLISEKVLDAKGNDIRSKKAKPKSKKTPTKPKPKAKPPVVCVLGSGQVCIAKGKPPKPKPKPKSKPKPKTQKPKPKPKTQKPTKTQKTKSRRRSFAKFIPMMLKKIITRDDVSISPKALEKFDEIIEIIINKIRDNLGVALGRFNRIEYNKIDSSIRRTLPANLYKFYKMERPSNIIPGELLGDVFETNNISIGLTIFKSHALLVRVVEYLVFEILTAAYDKAYDKARYNESDISSIIVSLSDVTKVIKEDQDFREFLN